MMEKYVKDFQSLAKEATSGGRSFKTSSSTPDAAILVPRASTNMVSLGTCTKVCAVSFVIGVVVGFTLKRRLRRWASKLLKQMKDD
ncbi:hypothetical protein QJS04_geneDACA004857 [Acorus gramineus]|uniref:Transmembrane protein n=2 Tax=Acorus TaxID=4464 RepID=A0AAV9E4M9_ACOCL|nr:hypothetical protein QJS04_geneDACA004857 [Acorus gramineus]KAK1307863.1 hypothetical protein QJS10_CPA09g00045 [Acorus calamus]